MSDPTHTDTTQGAETVATSDTPQSHTVITRTPDGACQSTVTVTVQVTTALGPPVPVATQRASDNDGSNTGGGPKGDGLSGSESPDDDGTNTAPPTKGDGLSGKE